MSIETRRVDKDEWALIPTEFAGEVLPDADQCIAVVAIEDSTAAIGRAFLMAPVHVEGIFVEQDRRNSYAMKRLVQGIEKEARNLRITTLFAYAEGEKMEDYIRRLGYEKLPWTVWRKEL